MAEAPTNLGETTPAVDQAALEIAEAVESAKPKTEAGEAMQAAKAEAKRVVAERGVRVAKLASIGEAPMSELREKQETPLPEPEKKPEGQAGAEPKGVECDESYWLKQTIRAAGDKKYPIEETKPPLVSLKGTALKSGGDLAWENFKTAYTRRFPSKDGEGNKLPSPTGDQIHEFQLQWCRKNLGVDLYAEAAALKAKNKAKTYVEIIKPFERNPADPNFQRLLNGLRYEIANKIGIPADNLTQDDLASLFGIKNPEDIPPNWGKKGDALAFNPKGDTKADIPHLLFVASDGTQLKGLTINPDAVAWLKEEERPTGTRVASM